MGTSILDLLKFKFKFYPPVKRKTSKKKAKKTKKKKTGDPPLVTSESINPTKELPASHVRSSPPLPDLVDLYDPPSGTHWLDVAPLDVVLEGGAPVSNNVISPVQPLAVDPNEMIHPAFRDDNPAAMLADNSKLLGEDLQPLNLDDVLTPHS
jgi:hypothetical protein